MEMKDNASDVEAGVECMCLKVGEGHHFKTEHQAECLGGLSCESAKRCDHSTAKHPTTCEACQRLKLIPGFILSQEQVKEVRRVCTTPQSGTPSHTPLLIPL